MISIWDRLDMEWPVSIGGQMVGLAEAREKAQKFLTDNHVVPLSFSHYGIVVKKIETASAALDANLQQKSETAHKAWVESYQVFVLRMDIEGVELEFIEPAGPSFFSDFLEMEGVCVKGGLQHVSFRVQDIEYGLAVLKSLGVELVDLTPRKGSHGKVAFIKPDPLTPLYIELCEWD